MDSTPGSAKRSRPTDSPAKGQPKSKIAAQEISPSDQADSSPHMEATKRADRPPGPLQWEEEKKTMQAQMNQLMYQMKIQVGFIKDQTEEFQASLLQMESKFSAALEQTTQQLQQLVHNSILASNQSITNTMKEVEAKVVKQITHITAKVIACENTVSSHEQRFAAMDESIHELVRETEDKLSELRIRRETSMDVDGQVQATIGQPPDRNIAFQITGIKSIKPYIDADPDADAADIVVELMELFGEYHAVLRIVIVDIKGKTRNNNLLLLRHLPRAVLVRVIIVVR
jgi:flagellar biosynthesis/type III secretory pathway protein FliH